MNVKWKQKSRILKSSTLVKEEKNMANNSWDDMNNQGNAGLGLLGLLGLATVGGIAKAAHNQKKAEKLAALKDELNQVRYELSKKKGNIFKEAWYTPEIEKLEARERELIQEINNL